MTRVLQAIRTVDSRQTGGPEELLLANSPLMLRRGKFEPVILLLRKPNPAADPAKDFGNRARALGIPVVPLQRMRWRADWLRALPDHLGVSLIHVHGQRANYFIWFMRRLFPRTWGRLLLVATVHGWVQDNFVRRFVTRLEWATLRECDHIITVSEAQKRTLLNMGFDHDKISVIRPGISAAHVLKDDASRDELRVIARERWGIPPDAFVVAGIGRLSTEKRFDLYLKACVDLAARIPGATFLLVGGASRRPTCALSPNNWA